MCVSFETMTTGSDTALLVIAFLRPRRSLERSREDERHPLPAAHRRGRRQLHAVVVDVPLGEAVQQLVEAHATFEPREVGAEAEVEALAEREVLDVVAVDVVDVGVGVAARVAVGRREQQQDRAAGRAPWCRSTRRPRMT